MRDGESEKKPLARHRSAYVGIDLLEGSGFLGKIGEAGFSVVEFFGGVFCPRSLNARTQRREDASEARYGALLNP